MAKTPDFSSPDRTPEDVLSHLEEICAVDDYQVESGQPGEWISRRRPDGVYVSSWAPTARRRMFRASGCPLRVRLMRRLTRQPSGVRTSSQRLADTRQTQ